MDALRLRAQGPTGRLALREASPQVRTGMLAASPLLRMRETARALIGANAQVAIVAGSRRSYSFLTTA